MKKYARLLSIFYKNTLINELEYRLNFWANLGTSLFWLVWAALSVRVYFYHAETIEGWNYDELLLYSFNLILQTTTFWLVNIERADVLVQGVLETGRFPIDFYRGWVKGALTVIVPVAFMTTFPAQALLGRLEEWTAAAAIGLAVLLFVLASAFWRFALHYYTGASS